MDAEILLKILEEGYEDSFLTPVYELKELPGVKARLAALVRKFRGEFPESREVSIVRAPGRVNLLGEHTDYSGLPVLPMAVPREVLCCSSRRRDKRVLARNVDPKYPPFDFLVRRRVSFSERGRWGNYVKAAFQGLTDHSSTSSGLPGLEMLFDGNIPTGAGLSSSSALVVATALAILSHSRKKVESLELAEVMAVAERYVGTQGGGMDQAASLLSEPGKALKIDFFPLRAESVDLAKGYSILVCNSMVEAEKTGAAMQAYNGRALECKLATAVLSRIAGINGAGRLGDLYRELGSAQLLRLIRSELNEEPHSLEDIARCLGVRPEEVSERFGLQGTSTGEDISKKSFRLKARAVHVVSEAARVEDGAIIMRKGDADAFGAVMNASHASCRNNFEVSCPELDLLTDLARENGAVGARLTGAGFGGCTVNLVPQQNLDEVKSRVLEAYYEDFLKRAHPERYEMYKSGTETVFEFRAAAGGQCLVA
ncbi:MAG: galactokinase [bacterium]|nr:galactokinase [bacterium]